MDEEYREYKAINHKWYNVNHFNGSINSLELEVMKVRHLNIAHTEYCFVIRLFQCNRQRNGLENQLAMKIKVCWGTAIN